MRKGASGLRAAFGAGLSPVSQSAIRAGAPPLTSSGGRSGSGEGTGRAHVCIGLALSVLALTACTRTVTVYVSSPSPSPTPIDVPASLPPAEGTREGSPSPTIEGESPVGATADNPVPIGDAANLTTWSVKVIGFTANADAAVAHENIFNEKPRAGYHYLLVTLRTANIGKKSSNPFFDLNWSLIGSDGRQYNSPSVVIPMGLSDSGNVPPGAFAEGNVVFEVADKARGLVLYLEDTSSFARTTFAYLGLPRKA